MNEWFCLYQKKNPLRYLYNNQIYIPVCLMLLNNLSPTFSYLLPLKIKTTCDLKTFKLRGATWYCSENRVRHVLLCHNILFLLKFSQHSSKTRSHVLETWVLKTFYGSRIPSSVQHRNCKRGFFFTFYVFPMAQHQVKSVKILKILESTEDNNLITMR